MQSLDSNQNNEIGRDHAETLWSEFCEKNAEQLNGKEGSLANLRILFDLAINQKKPLDLTDYKNPLEAIQRAYEYATNQNGSLPALPNNFADLSLTELVNQLELLKPVGLGDTVRKTLDMGTTREFRARLATKSLFR